MFTPILRRLLPTILCLALWPIPVLSQAQDNPELVIAHSRDRPSSLWSGLDATVEEIERDGRVSIFKLHERRGTKGAGGRFFICTMVFLTKRRGYVHYINGESDDGRTVVIFLKEHDEDIQAIIDDGYSEYKFDERASVEDYTQVQKFCVLAVNQ